MHLDHRPIGLAVALALGALACSDDPKTAEPAPSADAAVATDAGAPSADWGALPPLEALPAVAESAKARVNFKGGQRWSADLGRALSLSPDAVCSELGQYDCAAQVHTIALGGVEPYRQGVRSPLPILPTTSAIAVERIALSACIARADADFADPASAVLFGPLARAEQWLSVPLLEATGAALYDRLLARDANPHELRGLVEFGRTVAQDASARPARDWAVLACVAVATTTESLFF